MVMGIIDVDDKIIKRVNEMNIFFVFFVGFYEEDFKWDMVVLKVFLFMVYLRVIENIF